MSKAKDNDSWKARSIRRRDFRHTHNGPEIPRHKGKKHSSTKKWCKGKVGREHDLQIIERGFLFRFSWVRCKCTVCGKKIFKTEGEI